MVNNAPLGNSPSDNTGPKPLGELAALIVATVALKDIYTPTYVEVKGITTDLLARIKEKVTGYPWADVDQTLLGYVRRPESINLNDLAAQRGERGLPELSQFQKFLLQPGGDAVEFQHRLVLKDLSDKHLPSILSFVRIGPPDAAPQMRIDLMGGSRKERWVLVDQISKALTGRTPSDERNSTELARIVRMPLSDGVTLGLAMESRERHENSLIESPSKPQRHLWTPTSLEAPDPSYDTHQVMTSHAFPERYEEILRSGILVHLEAYANDTKPVSVARLSRIGRSLRQPLIASFRRTYEPSLSWFRASTGQGDDSDISPESPVDPRGVFSEALLSDPSKTERGRCLTFFAPHWDTATADGTLGQLGSITMVFYELADATGAADTLSIATRWRQLIRLLRELKVEVSVGELSRTLRETQKNAEVQGRVARSIAVKLGDSDEPSRLFSAHFSAHHS
jgi:hypothetical protein